MQQTTNEELAAARETGAFRGLTPKEPEKVPKIEKPIEKEEPKRIMHKPMYKTHTKHASR